MKKNNLNENELRMFFDYYDLNIVNQETPEFGNKNGLFILYADNGFKFVTKIYDTDFTEKTINFQLRLNEFVYNQGIPTPKPIKNLEGSLLTNEFNNFYSLMTFIDGNHPKYPNVLGELLSVFTGLAKFNFSLLKVDFLEDYSTLPLSEFDLNYGFEEILFFLPSNPKNELDRKVLNSVPKIKELIEETVERYSQIKLEKQLIHGDLTSKNVLVNNNELSAILDYDLVKMGFRGFDLIHALDIFCFEKEKEIDLNYMVDWDKFGKLFSNYKENDPLIEEQIEYLPLILLESGLRMLILTLGYGYKEDSTERQKDFFERRCNIFLNRIDIASKLENKIISFLG